jgi:hypothetical protein
MDAKLLVWISINRSSRTTSTTNRPTETSNRSPGRAYHCFSDAWSRFSFRRPIPDIIQSREPSVNFAFGKARNLHDLPRRRRSRDHPSARVGNTKGLGDSRLDRRVSLATLCRSGHPHLERTAKPAGHAAAGRARNSLDVELDRRPCSLRVGPLRPGRTQPCRRRATRLQRPRDGDCSKIDVSRRLSGAAAVGHWTA